ncbi:DedA family protein [Angustibacter sp. McL0619]|uniref:DedA family protein n=1 Tax=Angustibacter sp. McL0619 TaxID=3415676 RepID=UPI003CF602B5
MHALGPAWLDPQHLIDTYALPGTLLVVFIECGLFFFLLPGDSLLFTIGLLISNGTLHKSLVVVLPLLFVAAFAGSMCGYEIGRAVGPRIVGENSRLIRQKHVDQTHAFFERYGARALIIGRFVPIVRTFITLIAGVSQLDRRKFYSYSAIGAALWVVIMTLAGYFLGTIDFVSNNIEAIAVLIAVVSVVPIGLEYLRHRRGERSGSTS